MKIILKVMLMLMVLVLLAGQVMAATCTSKANGDWDQSSTWTCTGSPTITKPDALALVILASPYTVSLNGNDRTAASLTINAGATLDDDGKDLTITGSVVINGTYDGTGNNGKLIMTGSGSTLSGTGTVIDIGRIQIDANIIIPTGSNLNLTLRSEIRVGDNAAATLTIDGTITGTAQTNGNRLIRLDNNNTSNLIVNGTINAPNSYVQIQAGGVVTNNGSVTVQYLDSDGNNSSSVWTQGANSSLTLSQTPTNVWRGTFNASANNNTVTYTADVTPLTPSSNTYYNIGHPRCAAVSGFIILGSSPCVTAAPTATTGAASSVTAAGATLNGVVSSNGASTTVTFEYGLTTGYGSGPITATPSPVLGSNSSPTAVSAAVTGLACSTTYHFRVIGVNSVGTSNGLDGTFTTLACAAPTVVTNAASALSISGATLNATVSSNGADTTATFEYGPTASYGSSITATQSPVLGSNGSPTAVSAAVTGLTCNTLYHFRAKGVNSIGPTNGGDRTFTTSACPSLGAVINTYYPGSTASVAAGSTSITLGAATGVATPIAIGDTLLIMQMQDASINNTNTDAYGDGAGGDLVGRGTTGVGGSGVYEYVIASSAVPVGGGTLTLACGTTNAYASAAATASAGQKKYQVIRVPVYSNVTLTSTLTARAWDGSTGGVLAFDVTGALTLNSATVTVDGMGFRGGAGRGSTTGSGASSDYRTLATNLANGSKGEGIAGTPRYVLTAPSTSTDTGVDGYSNGSFARGAPGNAGGGGTDINPPANDENSGGGGGANGGIGGIGGIGWCPAFVNTSPYYGCGIPSFASGTNPGGSTGGFSGAAVTGLGATRLTLGGGGGAGTTNNSTGALGALTSSGAAGGGITMLRAASMSGTATFSANGSDGNSTVCNDGSGGGGAGGAVLINAGSGMGGVTISVRGGKGGDNLATPCGGSTPHGPGGGGGGGYAITSAGTAACNNAGGANGVTYNGAGVLFGAYGSTSGSTGSCTTGLTAAQIPGTALGATGCLNHYELSVPSSSITCLPTTVTVTACADNSNPCTSVAAGVSGTANLATTGGTIVTPATVTAGVASTTLSDPGAPDGTKVTVTLTSASPAAPNAATCRSGGDCSVVPGASTTFNTAGFIFSSTKDIVTVPPIPTPQVAGTSSGTYYLRAVKTSDNSAHTCGAAFSGAQTINFAYECNNPTTCYASDLMSVNGGTATTIARNNNGSVSSYLPVNMNFDATGNAPFTFVYSDVGQVTLWANKTVNSAVLTGSSNAFVVKPHHFDLSPIQQTAAPNLVNPAAADATGNKFVKAGEQFSVTVTAKNATNVATPNYGKEIAPEGVKLTEALVLPNLGQIYKPALGGGFGSFINGVATGTAFTWNEVGIITLTPSILSANYIGVAGDTIGTQSTVGRFYAAKFALSGGSIANRTDIAGCTAGCGPFTYMGEQMSALFTLTAKAVDGTTTLQNYNWSATAANQFAKLDPLAAVTAGTGGPLGMGAVDSAATRTPFTPCGVAPAHPCLTPAPATTGTFVSGAANVTVPFTIYRDNAAAKGPYALLDIGVAPLDSDGTIMAAYDRDTVNVVAGTANHTFVGSTRARFGRLTMPNMYGSERLPLAIPLQAQYWSGSYFINNADDNNTPVTAPLARVPTGTPPDGTVNLYFYAVPAKNLLSPATDVPTVKTMADVVTDKLSGGQAKLQFAAPLKIGWLDIILQVPDYLKYNWGNCNGQGTGTLMNDFPCARATFGIYKSPLIYRRENY